MKTTVKAVADSRVTSESEIFREAMVEYLAVRGIEMKETHQVIPHPVDAKPVNYRDPKRKVSSSPKMDTDHKIATVLREGSAGQKPGGAAHPRAKK